MTCRPGHPERHPDFEPDNTHHLVHGAYSPRAIAEKPADVHAELALVCPWLAEERYAPSLQRYLSATAREMLAHKALVGSAKFSPRALEAATSAARLAWAMADQLGLTPAGHQKLKLLVAGAANAEASIAELAERGHAIHEARLAELALERPDGPQSGDSDGDEEQVP